MHFEAHQFISTIKMHFYDHFNKAKVLEVGSYTVNHSIRDCFSECDYIGLDLIDGPGVDVVAEGSNFVLKQQFDTVISAECFEHNPNYEQTFKNMVKHCREGGLVAFSCATDGREEHGTQKTDPNDSPGTASIGWDYYKNLKENDFSRGFLNHNFSTFFFISNHESHDLYFLGFKKEAKTKSINDLSKVKKAVNSIVSSSILLKEFWSEKENGNNEKCLSIAFQIYDCLEHNISPMIVYYTHGYFIEANINNENIIEKHISHLMQHYPQSVFTAYLLGIYFYRKNLPHASIGSLNQAIHINGKFPLSYWALGRSYFELDDFYNALSNYEKTMECEPTWSWVLPYIDNVKKALNLS